MEEILRKINKNFKNNFLEIIKLILFNNFNYIPYLQKFLRNLLII